MKFKIIILLLLLLLLFYNSLIYSSIFDKVEWEYHSKRKDIKLFKTTNRFYKVETILNYNSIEDLVLHLTTRESYLKIFPKTKEYKKIEKLSKNKYLIYEVISFTPFKSRDCFFELEINKINDEWIIEWFPTEKEIKHKENNNTDYIRVKDVYGRWILKQASDESIYVSMEFFSDFKFKIPKVLLLSIEKEESFKILKDLESFLIKEKKFCYKK